MTAPTAVQLARDAIELFLENRDVHGHDEERARSETLATIAEYQAGWRVAVAETAPAIMAGFARQRRRGTVTCQQCGQTFEGLIHRSKYCGNACTLRASRARRAKS